MDYSLDSIYFSDLDESEKQNLWQKIGAMKENFLPALADTTLDKRQRGDMIYLLSVMLPADLAHVDGRWLRQHVLTSRQIMAMVPWGAGLNEDIYRNFILPFRVNNEEIDCERSALFARIWPRVAGLTAEEAVLQVNLYCYERVRYTATDIRTLGPASLLRRACGRCGEQSTLLTALLRSVGIPARQCYVPRWSHTESNHAWVEVYIGDRWRFLGACEPEPELDRGWFVESLQRAIAIQTRSSDAHYQLEAVFARGRNCSIINVTPRYIPCINFQIQSICNGRPVTGAQAQISVFNSGEFFVVHRFVTLADGFSAVFSLGRGDVLLEVQWRDPASGKVHAYWQIVALGGGINAHGLQLLPCHLQEHAIPRQLAFSYKPQSPAPPSAQGDLERTDGGKRPHFQAQIAAGDLAYQARLRGFQTEVYAGKILATFPSLQAIEVELREYLRSAGRGARELHRAFEQLFPRYGLDLWYLLATIPCKDRAFVRCFDLEDFLNSALRYKSIYVEQNRPHIWREYILAPKVDFEILQAHRRNIYTQITRATAKSQMSPDEIFSWLQHNIVREPDHGFFHYRGVQPPLRSFATRRADELSRKVLAVALLRIFGHPARLNQALLAVEWVEWFKAGVWRREVTAAAGREDDAGLRLGNLDALPAATQISLGWRRENELEFKTLYAGGINAASSIHGEGPDLATILSGFLPRGFYRLCYGLRAADGNVAAQIHHFSLGDGEQKTLELAEINNWAEEPALLVQLDTQKLHSFKKSTCRFSVYIATEKTDEPFYHVLHDLEQLPFGCEHLQLFFSAELQASLPVYLQQFPGLKNFAFLPPDELRYVEAQLAEYTNWGTASFPKFFLARHKGKSQEEFEGCEIVFCSCGYSRSAVTQLKRVLSDGPR